MLRLLTIAGLVCTVTSLMCGPAVAQAPKAKTGKAAAAGKDANKKKGTASKRPAPPPKPGADDAAAVPEKRVDPYLHVPFDEGLRKQVGKLRQDANRAFQNGRYEGDQEASLQTYYRRWVLPQWTQEDNYHMLPKMRNDLRNELRPAKPGQPHTDAIDILLRGMTRMANENFHPVVRYNAMLAIGDLNEREPVGFNGVPTPLPDAVPVLIDALTGEKQIDGVKVAALLGLIRHTRLGIADQQLVAQRLVPALLKLAAEKTPPANRSVDGHEWMRSLALDMLGLLRNVGNNNVVATTIGTIVADKKDVPEKTAKEMLVRCTAAGALGNLSYTNVSGLDPVALAEGLAGLALDACGRETATRSSDGEEVPIARRRLRSQLHAVAVGFNGADEQHKGIRGLAQDTPQRDYVERLYAGIQNLEGTFDKKDPKDTKEDIDDAEFSRLIGQGSTAILKMIELRASGGVAAADGAKPSETKPPEAGTAPKPPAGTSKPPAVVPGF